LGLKRSILIHQLGLRKNFKKYTETMRTIRLIYPIAVLAAAIFGSCSPAIYSNVGQNTPMFTEKGEFSINAAYSGIAGPETLVEEWATNDRFEN